MSCVSCADIAYLAYENDKHDGWENTCECVNVNKSCSNNIESRDRRTQWFVNNCSDITTNNNDDFFCKNVYVDVRNKCNGNLCFSILYNVKKHVILIYFPATSNFNDILYDIDLRKHTVVINDVEFHVTCGFWRKYEENICLLQHHLSIIFEKINLYESTQSWQIIISGFSLGATTAILCAACLPILNTFQHSTFAHHSIYVCVFGCPLFCCSEITRLLTCSKIACIKNFANQYDPVTSSILYPKWTCPIGNYIVTYVLGNEILNAHWLSVYKDSVKRSC